MGQDVIESFFKYDFGFSVFDFRYLRCEQGYTYGTHSHDHIEIGYVKEGTCIMIFGDQSIQFAEGDTMVVYPDAKHYFLTEHKSGCLLVQLEFQVNNLSVLKFKENPDENLLFLYSLLLNTRRFLKVRGNNKIQDNMDRLFSELERTPKGSSSLAKLYFFELFIHLSNQLKEEKDFFL